MSILSTVRMYLRRTPKLSESTDLYAHRVKLLDGGELDLGSLRGNPTLIVNTASKCGFTPQYAGLQSLYGRYHDRGLQILGSPSPDFAGQEAGDWPPARCAGKTLGHCLATRNRLADHKENERVRQASGDVARSRRGIRCAAHRQARRRR